MKNNKIITEFMGIEPEQTLKNETVYAIEMSRNNPKKLNDIATEFYSEDELKYHLSWDWIIPVMNLCKERQLFGSQHLIDKIDDALTCDCEIEHLHEALVVFIEYYNKNTSHESNTTN